MNDTISIVCPEHPQSQHTAFLHQKGHMYPGVWECPVTGDSDVCEHENTHYEDIEVDTTRNGEHDTYMSRVEVCDVCECEVEGRE